MAMHPIVDATGSIHGCASTALAQCHGAVGSVLRLRYKATALSPARPRVASRLRAPHSPQDIAVSSGSACTSASLEPSYVLRALGVQEDMAHTSIRYGLGRFTTDEEVDRAVELTVAHVEKLRAMSPLWEMVQVCFLGEGEAGLSSPCDAAAHNIAACPRWSQARAFARTPRVQPLVPQTWPCGTHLLPYLPPTTRRACRRASTSPRSSGRSTSRLATRR